MSKAIEALMKERWSDTEYGRAAWLKAVTDKLREVES